MNKTMHKVTIAFVAIRLCSLMELPAEDKMDSRNELPSAKEIEEAVKVPAKKEEFGKILLSLFLDKDQPVKKRIECALTLGKLKYLPAIPKLIEFIDLQDPEGAISEALIENMYPCIRALADCGDVAVPAIIDAYAKEPSEKRLGLLYFVIRCGKTEMLAIELARKSMSEQTDADAKIRLKGLIIVLAKEKLNEKPDEATKAKLKGFVDDLNKS